MSEQRPEEREPDAPHGADTGVDAAHSDDVDVHPGPRGPGEVSGSGAGPTAGLPGRGHHPELPDDEADDTIGGLEPYDDEDGPDTDPYRSRRD